MTSALLTSCGKNKEASVNAEAANLQRSIDSINAARLAYNDSIRELNRQNHFPDLSGAHKITHNGIPVPGKVIFENIGRDRYRISGEIRSGKNFMKIEGEIKKVSGKYLNFTGTVTQSLQENDGGKTDVRSGKTSFLRTGNSRFWRYQNRLNSSGFTDDIDLY